MWAYRFLVLRDGERCARCYEIPTTPNTLDIDHIDDDHWNNHPENLRLLCRACNVTLENKRRVLPTPQNDPPSDKCVGERQRAQGQPSTQVVRGAVDFSQGEPTMQANFLYELDFRRWVLSQVQEKGYVPKLDTIAAGAEVVGCSPATSARYLLKLTSSVGPLQEIRDMLGGMMLTWKNGLKPEEEFRELIDLDKLAREEP